MKIIEKLRQGIYSIIFNAKNKNSGEYWEKRYLKNGNSGEGSYGTLAIYKAGILNTFVKENGIKKVIDYGCGDGNQLLQFAFSEYVGLDVSGTAIKKCRNLFINDVSKSFFVYNPGAFANDCHLFKADLSLSLDVIYHLLEDDVFERYMHDLFSFSTRFVIIYAWDVEGKRSQHVRHRKFTEWIAENVTGWDLIEKIGSGEVQGACDFFIYEKVFIDNG